MASKARKTVYGYKTAPDGQVVIDRDQAQYVTEQYRKAAGGSRRSVKVTGIRKEIDTEKFAMVLWMQAKRQAREKREAVDQAQDDTPSTPEAQ